MRPNPTPLSPADRRALAADLFARRLLELASRGILQDLTEDPRQLEPAEPIRPQQPAQEVADGPR